MTAKQHRYAVIFAGGRGTRLWPVSTETTPKQFHTLVGEWSLLAETYARLRSGFAADHILVSTARAYAPMVRDQIPELPAKNVVEEPLPAGKARAYALVAETLRHRDPEAIFLAVASDHWIGDTETFQRACSTTMDFVEGNPGSAALVGVTPTHADIGLGYVRVGERLPGAVVAFHVAEFVEKPSEADAIELVRSRAYYWNTSYYCFSAMALLDAYEHLAPGMVESVQEFLSTGADAAYAKGDGLDHELRGLVAAGYPVALVTSDLEWNDIGSWPSIHRVLSNLEQRSVVSKGAHLDADSDSTLVINETAVPVVTVGLSDVVVIVTDHAIVISSMSVIEASPSRLTMMAEALADLAQPGDES
ncbi:MAG TPA: sugar phosphate nucleotidyltransferase [Phycicoccus elongatus]|jgi:mannose-1-phosphate guanylyltransferase|nr:sugar phosphate nucleotidyltransferase [Phycicoccus elongatus]